MPPQQALTTDKLNNKQRAALLMLSLDVETAAQVMKRFTQQEIERLTVEITHLKGVHSTMIDHVVEEFHQLITAQEYVVQGGLDYAQKLLEKSVGFNKASEIMDRIKALTHTKGFGILKEADGAQLATFLAKEHPQTIALILSNLSPEQVAKVLSEFPDEMRNDVVFRIATLGKVSPSLLTEMEAVVEAITESEMSQNVSSMGGTQAVATVLNKCSNVMTKVIIEHLEQREPHLASEVKRLMFLFEDLIYVDDRGIQRMLREVDKKDLALALKTADEKLKAKMFANMSERAKELLQEELQFMGPVRLKEVEAAQVRIVEVVKQLEDAGEIIVAGRGGTEEVVV
jgi:flagellar motor switch protein FliG